jgi:hypothetical protein
VGTQTVPFQSFYIATTVVNAETRYYERVYDWTSKRHALLVQLHDFPALIAAYKGRSQEPYAGNPKITMSDEVPRIRLVNACESTTNTLYSLAEVAANFANLASRGQIPSSFNALRKKVRVNDVGPMLKDALGDLQWYEKVRELRTEWAHYSSAFLGEHEGEPILVVRCYRRPSDRAHFDKTLQCSIQDVIDWTRNAITTIDNFSGYLLKKYVLPRFDLDATLTAAQRDSMGMPIVRPDGTFVVETVTIREYLTNSGLDLNRWL